MSILVDIGGTFVRFAVLSDGEPQQIEKYAAADFKSFEDALNHYCQAQDMAQPKTLRIATAGYEDDDGLWKFVNQNKWVIDPATLRGKGWDIECILNDFEAATWALLNLDGGDAQTLKDGDGASQTRCLIGPGTGLGLGYLHGGDHPHVQKTHGGHIPIAAVTEDQKDAVQKFQDQRNGVVVFENIVSGPGLEKLRAFYDEENALRLFHEFFGLFAATVVVSGHAYGGLYLTGGVLEHLIKDGVFDFEVFEKWFCFEAVDSVKHDLNATPIVHITYPTPALRGLVDA